MDRIEIDGAAGGGQLLRTALTLSLCTGTAFEMRGIRAKRARPGLMRQHLTAVAAATRIGNAQVAGAEPGATTLSFEPGAVTPGTYQFSIGTAGSATLVLQTVLPALWACSASSELKLEGGTHNPMAPSADFLADTYLPALARMGVVAGLALEKHGFYPAGGGCIVARIDSCAKLQPLMAVDGGKASSLTATALISALSEDIGQRELKVVARHFGLDESALMLHRVTGAVGPGNALVIRVRRGDHVETFTGFGERGVSAEQVAERLVRDVRDYVDSGAHVGPHLADQMLIPMALAGSGEFTTTAPTDHLKTNAALVEKFVPVEIGWERIDDRRWRVVVRS
jgi:RNA 3'-terminal phosphate cyclase (ATP)